MNHQLTRLAPTPSGFLHLGNLYSFLLTQALAEKTGAKILLRIDDLDRERYQAAYVQDIFDTLDFMEIRYDLGPKTLSEFEKEWSQIHRMDKYREALDILSAKGAVFACECSRKKIQQYDSSGYYLGLCQMLRIPLDKENTSWRMDTFETDFIKMKSYPGETKSYTMPHDTAFFVVRKRDGLPAYQLSSVVDDLHFGVDLIVRGKDLQSSTLAQLMLSGSLEQPKFNESTFHHHPLLKGAKNKKLSKSAGDTSIQFLRKEGKKPADLYRILGELMGAKEQVSSYGEFKELLDF
ncbi:glutamate--tRNA ligase family protein [Algoriphagus halophytocola]|uniref:Glutamate--tRNA ligase family protein n=1 Tax=Algoriphagus halophytocola TaxID=2991499 RepID=A0ABY6MII4_9BACT|nr:glutamate--tRNA ligase family protein [Algoriphagus sp. TR-M5]UZD23601.1 glutamate--tRNA ligase family protein [Algoriphagus sp. TR-M5]